MAFTRYQSTDPSAPVLSGTAGTLIAVLDAILINGYGTQPAAGWSKVWTGDGGNSAIYKPASTPDFFLKVNDNAAGTGLAREALVSAGTAHDGAGNLTNATPQNLNLLKGFFWRKSTATGTTARAWNAWADSKTLIFQPYPQDSADPSHHYYAGLFIPYAPGDAHPYALTGRHLENSTTNSNSAFPAAWCEPGNSYHAGIAHSLRADGGTLANFSRWAHPNCFSAATTAFVWGTYGPAAPGPISGLWPFFDGGFFSEYEPRGRLRGMVFPMFSAGSAPGDTITVTLNGVARTYRVSDTYPTGRVFIEESDTLDL